MFEHTYYSICACQALWLKYLNIIGCLKSRISRYLIIACCLKSRISKYLVVVGCLRSRTASGRCSGWVRWYLPVKSRPAGEQRLQHEIYHHIGTSSTFGGHNGNEHIHDSVSLPDIYNTKSTKSYKLFQIPFQGAVSNRARLVGRNKSNSAATLLAKETDEDPKVGSRYPNHDPGDESGAAEPGDAKPGGVGEPSKRELPSRRCCRLRWFATQVTKLRFWKLQNVANCADISVYTSGQK